MIVNKYNKGGGGSPFDPTQYYTKSQTDAAITAATEDLASEEYVDEQVSGLTEYIEDVERVTATALTELHTDVLALSAATPDMSDYYTKSEVDAEITGATEGFATEAYVDATITSATQDFVTEEDLTGYTSMQDFEDFQDAISVKEEVIASALTELHDAVEDIDLTNYYTKSEVDSEISTATADMVESQDVKHIVKLTQAQYDLIANPDPETLYIITNS